MTLTIHRGSHQIGGSCIELSVEGSRIILDLGMPLGEPRDGSGDGTGLLPDIPGLYAYQKPGVDAVIVSHVHGDHSGLVASVHPHIPVYTSAGTAALFGVNEIFLPWLPKLGTVHVLPKGGSVPMGRFLVKCIPVDHSAPDALGVLVEAEGKRIFYSGDFRAHGRKGGLFRSLIRKPPRNVDCLLLEGTMMGQPERACHSEAEVERKMRQVFEQKRNLALVFCSSQNIDRIVSIYRAVKGSGCFLVMDLYTAYVMDAMRVLSGRLPQGDWPGIRVFYHKEYADRLGRSGHEDFLYRMKTSRIRIEELSEKKAKAVVLAKSNSLLPIIPERMGDHRGFEAVWSMWPGYLSGEDPASRFFARNRMEPRMIHAGGHAGIADLRRLAETVNPAILVPIHTAHPEHFPQFFKNTRLVADGCPIAI